MKVLFWLLVALGFVYAFYAGAVAVYSYYQVTDIVKETVTERAGVDRYERAERIRREILKIRREILKKATESGVPLSEREVRVTDDNRTLRVLIRWSYPVIFYKGDAVLSIPLKYERSFEMPSSR